MITRKMVVFAHADLLKGDFRNSTVLIQRLDEFFFVKHVCRDPVVWLLTQSLSTVIIRKSVSQANRLIT